MFVFRLATRRTASLAIVCVATFGTGCRDRHSSAADSSVADSASASAASAPETSVAPTTTASAATATPTALEPADIDRWQKGMVGELEAVHAAGDSLRTAKTSDDTLAAMMAANETSTRVAGARAAGVDEGRYQLIRTTLGPLAAHMAPIALTMDVSKLPASARETLKKSQEASLAQAASGLPPSVVDAMRPRAAELRKQDLELTAARLRAAGATP